MTDTHEHWQRIWGERAVDEVSWFQRSADRSYRLVTDVAGDGPARVVDVGGGASPLAGQLVRAGHDVTVLDVSEAALDAGRARLGDDGERVQWVAGDVTTHRFDRTFDVWHDRAVLHFLTDPDDAARYVERLVDALEVDGHAVIAPFGPDGPTHCSGLEVQRYGRDDLAELLGERFEPVTFETEDHTTPGGATQRFLYGVFRRT